MKTNKLREIRKNKGYTQDEIGKLLGYKGKSGYSILESGKVKMKVETSIKLKGILKMSDEEYNEIFLDL